MGECDRCGGGAVLSTFDGRLICDECRELLEDADETREVDQAGLDEYSSTSSSS